jgi:hypothetical protein
MRRPSRSSAPLKYLATSLMLKGVAKQLLMLRLKSSFMPSAVLDLKVPTCRAWYLRSMQPKLETRRGVSIPQSNADLVLSIAIHAIESKSLAYCGH